MPAFLSQRIPPMTDSEWVEIDDTDYVEPWPERLPGKC